MKNSILPAFPADVKRLLRARLLQWFGKHKRELPWREATDPYRVWVSEIMLQQTRVAAVLGHYHEFLRRFPNLQALATAELQSVLSAWSGLGYYRRARSLHEAARKVVRDFDGELPCDPEQIAELPGIGRYTAAAIASIAFGQPFAVVDGNVARVLSRLRGRPLLAQHAWPVAQELLSPSRPGDFNQAMMELGATVCLPGEPNCVLCPIAAWCATKGRGNSVRQTQRRRKRELVYSLRMKNGSVFLMQRAMEARLMPGMWELPIIDSAEGREVLFNLRHSITESDYRIAVVNDSPVKRRTDEPGHWIKLHDLRSIALTGLARKILRKAEII